jgi:hypothetical protein
MGQVDDHLIGQRHQCGGGVRVGLGDLALACAGRLDQLEQGGSPIALVAITIWSGWKP